MSLNNFPVSNRTLGTLGLIGAPTMLIGIVLPMYFPYLKNTSFDGLSSLFFMLTWMGSLVGLNRLKATGNSFVGRTIIQVNLVTITFANGWNIYQAIAPNANTPLYWFLDAFWPISMVAMFLVGLTVVRAHNLRGWQRYVPLSVGLWLPLSALIGNLLAMIPSGWISTVDASHYGQFFSGFYAALGWGTLAYIVRLTPQSFQITRFQPNLSPELS